MDHGCVRESALDAIGNTPLVRLRQIVPEGVADVLVKLEYFNPTGSYKDRMALAMIEGAERRGDLRPGMTVVEYTGGSTGSSLAFVCAVKGYRCRSSRRTRSREEKLRTMRAFGAEWDHPERRRADHAGPDPAHDRPGRASWPIAGHLLDRPVQQPRLAGRLRGHRPRAAPADRSASTSSAAASAPPAC